MNWFKQAQSVIVEQKTTVKDIWICPHCNEEIGEKALYSDGTNFFHRKCMKGAIVLPTKDSKLTEEQKKINVFDTDEANLKRNVELEQEAIDIYLSHIAVTKREHIKKLLEHIISEEKNHKKELEIQLENIDKPVPEKITKEK